MAWLFPQAPTPPDLVLRPVSKLASLPGTTSEVVDGEVKFTLYIPAEWKPHRNESLTIHFHGAPWFAIQEHIRLRTLTGPLIAFSNGEGSDSYRRPFLDRSRFKRWIRLVEQDIHAKITTVSISSFSAGYGAVREILRDQSNYEIVDRIVLADSMYAGWEPIFPGARNKRPAHQDFDLWLPFAKLAIEGKKEFLVTHSMVKTPYAASYICARWLCLLQGMAPEAANSAYQSRYPILTRVDAGNFHVWGFAGDDANAHTVHARNIAEDWKFLDDLKIRRLQK